MYVTCPDAPSELTTETPAMHPEQMVIELVVELTGSLDAPPTGWLRANDMPPRPFDSYVELIGALEELRSGAPRPSAREQ
jgi:hypothetical protein